MMQADVNYSLTEEQNERESTETVNREVSNLSHSLPTRGHEFQHFFCQRFCSSGHSSWLQIQRPGFDSRHYQKKVMGLERGPLILLSTTEELLDRKVVAPV
jgi:hypothetical protein